MTLKDFKKANELVSEIDEIDLFLDDFSNSKPDGYPLRMYHKGESVTLSDQKIINSLLSVLYERRKELIKRLEML